MNKLYDLKEKLLLHKTPILYASSSIAKAIASILVSFVIARYLPPEDLGLWASISLSLTYASFLQAGVTNGLNLELPTAYGKGQNDKAILMAGTAQTYTLFITLFILLIGLLSFFFLKFDNLKIKYGVLAITLIICFSFYSGYLTSTFRSKSSFLKLSYIQIADSIANIATLIFIIFFLYYGLILKAVIVAFISMSLLHLYRPIKVGLILDKKIFLNLMKVGLPVFALSYVESFATTFDKLYLIRFANLIDLGLYSFAYYAYVLFVLLSTSIASYIYPRMTFNFAQNNNKKGLWLYVKKITLLIIIIQTPILFAGYFLIPIVLIHLFPQYILSSSSMQLLLIAGFFKGCVIGVNVLWSMKEWKLMIYYQFLYSFLLISLTYIFYKLSGFKIEGLAFGMICANIINFFSGMFFSFKGTNKSR